MDKLSTIKERWFEKQMLMLEDRGLNKTQIANKLGISTQHLNSMISGARGLSDNFLDNFVNYPFAKDKWASGFTDDC
jgi:hypothetical protein